MNILFTICGRAGSKGFKNKNLKKMNNIPLVYYTIAAIRAYMDTHQEHIVNVALNTDSQELVDICAVQKCVDIYPVERKMNMAGDISPKVDVIQDTYRTMIANRHYDIVVDLDITSPLRTLNDIEEAIRVYQRDINYDVVYSVVPSRRNPYFNMVEKTEDGYYHKVCEGNFSARQQAPDCYELNASIYVYSPRFLSGNIDKPLSQYKTGISVMKDYLVLDIDSEEDFFMMEFLHRYYIKNDEGIHKIHKIAFNMCKE